MNNYFNKYLKYKKKYMYLKKQSGGVGHCDDVSDIKLKKLCVKCQQEKYNKTQRTRGTTIATGSNAAGSNTGRLQDSPTLKTLKGN